MQLEKLPSIWAESPPTLSYSNRAATIDRTKRFDIDSIYYKDDPTKPKKKIDEFMFPMQILQDFRKSIREASKSKEKKKIKRPASIYDEEQTKSIKGNKTDSITKRLYQKSDPLFGSRDFFGNRCSMHERQLNDLVRLPTFKSPPSKNSSLQKLYVTAANRLDLSRPSNFNPGPGSYLKEAVFTTIGNSSLSSSMNSEESILRKKRWQRTALQSIHNHGIIRNQ